MATRIYVSYRRDDMQGDAFAAKYGAADVFMDPRDHSGCQVFDKVTADELARNRPKWMKLLSARMATGDQNLRRAELPPRSKHDLIVIPVLIDRARQPSLRWRQTSFYH